jgi:hypothetical protein
MNLRAALSHLVPVLVWSFVLCGAESAAQAPAPDKVKVPRIWDDDAMKTLEVPLANPAGSPKHVPASYYYKIPVRPIYKQYPVYAPGREPVGYMNWLNSRSR